LHKTNINQRLFQQEVIIIIKLFISIIFNGFLVLSFSLNIVFVFHPPEKRCIEFLLYKKFGITVKPRFYVFVGTT
jgi:hypothetical protein